MRVLMPLPDNDFDVTEVAVPWRLFTRAGHEVVFATEAAAPRPRATRGCSTGVLFGQLGAAAEPQAFYAEMAVAPEFQRPVAGRDAGRDRLRRRCSCPAGTRPA